MGNKVKGSKRSASAAEPPSKKAKLPLPPSDSEEIDMSSSDQSGSEVENEDDLDDLDNKSSDEDDLDDLDNKSSDEDDLDDLDNKSSNEDDLNESSDEKDDTSDKKSSREAHAEQKKTLLERKLQRKAGAEVQQIKVLWEKLRVNKPTPPKQVRDKLCDQVWELAKDVILDLVMKHDASRVVQTLVKFLSRERRDIIARALTGNYYKLATSSYGKYLLIKLLHYGSRDTRDLIVNELHGKLRKLMRHKEGAYVVEDLFVLYLTAAQRRQMIREFWGAEYAVFKENGEGKTVLDVIGESAEKRAVVMTNLYDTITAAVEKGSTGFEILHAAMREYTTILLLDPVAFESQIREVIELLAEQFAELIHTQEGSDVACTLIALANAKERKTILRHVRTHIPDMARNEYGHIVVLTFLMTVDDSVLLHKSVSVELLTEENTPALIQDKFLRRPILYIMRGLDPRYFSPAVRADLGRYEALAYAHTTKKPQEARRNELLSRALPLVYGGIIAVGNDFKDLVYVNMAAQFVAELCLTPGEDELRLQVVDMVFSCTVEGDVREDYHLLNKVPFIARLVKALVQGTEFRFDAEKRAVVSTGAEALPSVGTVFAERAAKVISAKPSDWGRGQPAFVAVSVLEVLDLAKSAEYAKLKKAFGGAEIDDDKGGMLLKKTL